MSSGHRAEQVKIKFVSTSDIADFPKKSEHFAKILLSLSEVHANISKQSSKMFRSYRNKFRFRVEQINFDLVNLIADKTCEDILFSQ